MSRITINIATYPLRKQGFSKRVRELAIRQSRRYTVAPSSYPYVRIYLEGKVIDEFSAKRVNQPDMDQADITKRALEIIGKCTAPAKAA